MNDARAITGPSSSYIQRYVQDSITGALVVLDSSHQEVHGGDHYSACDHQVAKTAFDYLLTTPATKHVHCIWEFVSDGKATIEVYEAATATASANTIAAYNNDRNSANAATAAIVHTPTAITPGTTKIFCGLAGSAVKVGGGSRSDTEFILKQNTKYLFRIAAASSIDFIMRWYWYEET